MLFDMIKNMNKNRQKNAVLKAALNMIGTPYVYGAYTKNKSKGKPSGVDCSSLIKYVYGCAGIDLPRSSILQASRGTEIKNKKDAEAGDLIFFETTKGHYWHLLFDNKKIYIGHVSLYIGNGYIIDASEDRNAGKVAKMKLIELTKKPGYEVMLIKRIIGIKELDFNLTPYSQILDVKLTDWKNRACGITSLKMVLDFLSKETKNKYPAIDDLILKYSKTKYINDIGWSHKGLADIAIDLGLKGINYDLINYTQNDALALLTTKLITTPVIASIYKNLNPKNSGHLVVVTRIENNKATYYDPDSKTRNEVKRTVSLKKFLSGWKKRMIVVWP